MDDANAKKEVEIATREAARLSGEVTSVKIRKDADLQVASDLLSEIKKVSKAIETKRKTITGPLNAALKEVNKMFKEPLGRLSTAEDLIKNEMLVYQERVDRRAAKKIEKIQTQVESGEIGMADGMAKLAGVKQGPTGIDSEAGQTQFKKVHKLKIVDPGIIPAGYFLRPRVLEALRLEIEADIKLGNPVPSGAEWVEESQVAVRIK